MGGFSGEELAFAFGIMGNIISFFVFLSPLPTFYKIYKKKSTAGFQSVPYVVALFSAMLLMYYAFLKIDNATLLITINSFGCLIETIYIGVYIFYAPKKGQTMKLLGLMIGGFGMILVLTQFLVKSPLLRLHIVGWICLVFSVSVFAAPLCILKQVIRTKSVEYMPFSLSLSLTLNAIMWFFYGLLIKDFNIAIPNVIGFFFGIIQMVLYAMYRNPKKFVPTEEKIPCDKITEHQMIVINDIPEKLPGKLADQVIDVVKLSAILCPEIIPHLNGNAIAGDFNHLNIPKPNMGIPVAV